LAEAPAHPDATLAAPTPPPAAPPAPGRFALRRRHLWIIAPLALIWIFQCFTSIEPFDFWWNVTSGRIMAQTGRFLGTDVLVFSPVREPYSNPQWLAQLLFYAVYALSPGLLLALRAAIITAAYGLIYAVCFRRSRSYGWSAVATLAAYVTGLTNYGMRPQLFAFLPFTAFLFLLESKAQRPRALWLLAPIMAVWVNVHGSYFLGWALLGIYGAASVLDHLPGAEGRRWLARVWPRREALPMAVAALAAFLNPYGLGIIAYFFTATGDKTARDLNIEWQPPTLYNGTGILFFANAGLFLLLLLASRRRVGWTEGLLLGAFGFLALLSIRNVIWWGWVTAPGLAVSGAALLALLARALRFDAEPAAEGRTEIPVLNWAFAVALVGAALVLTPITRPPAKALDKTTPTAVAAWLAARAPHGPLFNYMEWGGYLEWVLYPREKLFIDGRFEARQEQVWQDYLAISRGERDWQARLDRYGIDSLVLNRDFDSALIPLLAASPQWAQVYPARPGDDPAAVVFDRR
jgi:hypothetical protein